MIENGLHEWASIECNCSDPVAVSDLANTFVAWQVCAQDFKCSFELLSIDLEKLMFKESAIMELESLN
jgi:hypothetical protein